MDIKEFQSPDSAYRGKPFWAWNGKLEKEELIRQIHVFKRMGFGGFFMHSRTGLKTEYLGEEWFEFIRACTDEARKLGLEAWLYDEDRWPSGTAGGMVTKNPRYRQKFLSMYRVKREDFDLANYGQEYVNSFAVKFNNNQEIIGYHQATDVEEVEPGCEVLIFVIEEQQKQEFYNGYTYLDVLNEDAVKDFFDKTLEKYREKCGDLLGKGIKGIFTDEPHRGCVLGGFSIKNPNACNMVPYTYSLFEAFHRKKGYDLRSRLPEIYFFKQNEDWSKVSYDYIEVLQQLFIENYAKPYQRWCKQNNIILTGHVLHEDSLSAQTAVSGSVQRFYEYMDYPGIDILSENNYCFWVAKQAVSVSKQLGRPFVLSELYGCTGWQLGFEGHKFIGDWQAALGINLRCHHLSWYTMEGEAKRDYPASIFYQSAWSDAYKYVEDYFARMAYILSQGKPVTEVLVINPIESVWGKVRAGCFEGLSAIKQDILDIENNYAALFWKLSGNSVDFDYCDEDILSRHCRISGDVLAVGEMEYRVVVVSDLVTIRESTLRILREFKQKGGKVLFKGAPKYVDGIKQDFDFSSFERAQSHDEIVDFCKRECGYKIDGAENLLSNMRKVGDDYYIVLLNGDRKNDVPDVDIEINLPLNAEEWDLRTGQAKRCDFKKTSRSVIIHTSFEKGRERCFRLTPHEVARNKEDCDSEQALLPEALEYKLLEDNVLVLDFAEYHVNGERKGFDEILKVDRKIRKELGLNLRGGEMIQPWYKEKYNKTVFKKSGCGLTLKYAFYVESIPKKISLALESPNSFVISLNEREINREIAGSFIDNAIKVVGLPLDFIKTGYNEISLSCAINEEIDLEACYLIGDFGVKLDGAHKTITKLPQKLDQRPLHEQHLPFYTGKIEFTISLPDGRYKMRFKQIKGACYEIISQSGRQIVAFPPYETEPFEAKGEIKLVLNCTRRNLFGPLHLTNLFPPFYGPESFLTEGKDFQMDYALIDEGLSVPQVFKLP